MTRRKTRNLPSTDESPKSTRRSSRKRNDADDSPLSEENDRGSFAAKTASKSPRPKRVARHASPPHDANSASTRRSLRRPAPSGNAEEEELASVPPVKKLRGRPSVSSPNNNSISAVASSTAHGLDSEDSESDIKSDEKGDPKHVRNPAGNTPNAESVQHQKSPQKAERTRKRKLVESNEDDNDASVTTESGKNCINNAEDNNVDAKTRSSGKSMKEETGKRRKVVSAVSQKINAERRTEANNGHEKGDRDCDHEHTNGIDEDALDDWSGWSEGSSDGKKESLLNRVWKSEPNLDSKENVQFSILSYNILAESLLKTSHYFKNISPSQWNQQNRHRLLMKELAVVDADILCLQEVEKQYFQSSLSKDLTQSGYRTLFACSDTPGREEGLALCFRDSLFRLVAEKSSPLARIADQLIDELNIPLDHKAAITDYVNEPQMLQCVLLECRRSGKHVCVSNIHVSYAKHLKLDLRCAQVARTMWEVATFVALHLRREDQDQDVPFILCGDFNSTPESPVYQLCRDGYLNDRMLNRLQKIQNIKFPSSEAPVSLVNVLWKAFQHPVRNVRSSYCEIFNREPPLTQNVKGNKGCLDYVWFSQSGLKVTAALPPRCGAIKELEDALPNGDFPSDHLSLAVRFSFP